MNAVDVIEKKRDGHELTEAEIRFFIEGFTRGDIPDYQASAWAMAVLLRGMTERETFLLTQAMVESGEQIDLSDVVDYAVDKHSTGGVGDKTTLVVEPIVAAQGLRVGKMSGRGLSFTGGTLDKMESIAGFHSDLTTGEFIRQLREVGLVLSGQTAEMAPADGKLYSLRDVTGTVPSLPLIAASVMSKKLASGAQAIVLDVKVGLGAFMQSVKEAERLARLMVRIGEQADRRMVALLSDMNQPLGRGVGNALEVREAIDTLRGEGPEDFKEHSVEIAAHLLVVADRAESVEDGRAQAHEAIGRGTAFEKFLLLVEVQGGDRAMVENPSLLPRANVVQTVHATRSGYVAQVDAREVGLTVVELGGGRLKKGDPIDHAVGVEVLRNVGDPIEAGEPLFIVHARTPADFDAAAARVHAAHRIEEEPVPTLPLFYATILGESSEAGSMADA